MAGWPTAKPRWMRMPKTGVDPKYLLQIDGGGCRFFFNTRPPSGRDRGPIFQNVAPDSSFQVDFDRPQAIDFPAIKRAYFEAFRPVENYFGRLPCVFRIPAVADTY